jgi:LysR family glycine cleavage system transcriptional activator
MNRKLPPLNALRAFEAAARHLSFTTSAKELSVTQAAVSHQVKHLEEHLGVQLFKRQNRALQLTETGRRYLPEVRQAFDLLDEATRRLTAGDTPDTFTVTALPSFSARWLVPRLGRFIKANPNVNLRLAPAEHLVDFERDGVDVAIRSGRGHYTGMTSEWLMSEDLFPVCSPTLLEGDHPLDSPQQLTQHTLLHDDHISDWRTWLLAASIDNVDVSRGLYISDSSMLLQAAIDGQGVALARGILAADDLAAGRLVKPFALTLPSEFAYYLVYPRQTSHPTLDTFRNWVLAESKHTDMQQPVEHRTISGKAHSE